MVEIHEQYVYCLGRGKSRDKGQSLHLYAAQDLPAKHYM